MHNCKYVLRPILSTKRKATSILCRINNLYACSYSFAAHSKNKNQAITSEYYNGLIKRGNSLYNERSKRYYSVETLPPHSKIVLPALSPTMETGTIISWTKNVGDTVSEGDLLAEIETDKATMGMESPEDGFLAKILITPGTKDVPVGKLLCIIVSDQNDIKSFNDYVDDDSITISEQSKETKIEEAIEPKHVSGSFPDHYSIKLPALSPTMETGTLQSWSKNVGDELSEGDVLAQIETDKAVMEFETPEIGYLAKIFIPAETKNVKVGDLLCIIVDSKDKIESFKDFKDPGVTSKTKSVSKKKEDKPEISIPTQIRETIPAPAAIRKSSDHIAVSPYAKKLAKEKNIDLTTVQGTGPNGRIVANDIINYKPSTSTAFKPIPLSNAEFFDIELSNMRQIIAKRLIESKTTVPHYYLSRTIVIDELLKSRAEINQQLEKIGEKISLNDLIIKAVAYACKNVPQGNSAWFDTFIRQYNRVDVSVAVATENGLITPIVVGACEKSVSQIAKDVKELATKAKENKLKPEEYQGGTITVSNLGMFGITNFSAIINPPQSCILAVGSGFKAVIPANNNVGYKTVDQMQVTLSCDHRVVDGAVGAQWLDAFAKAIEKPVLLLI